MYLNTHNLYLSLQERRLYRDFLPASRNYDIWYMLLAIVAIATL